jgi:WD40 repeat protein
VKLWRLPGQNLTGTPSLQLVMTLTGATGKIWQLTACRHEPLVVGATDTGKVILWNTNEPAPLQVLAGHLDAAWAVALGPSEQRLFSGGWDQTVRLWGVTARDWEQKSAE